MLWKMKIRLVAVPSWPFVKQPGKYTNKTNLSNRKIKKKYPLKHLIFREAANLGEIGEIVSRVASLNAVQWLK